MKIFGKQLHLKMENISGSKISNCKKNVFWTRKYKKKTYEDNHFKRGAEYVYVTETSVFSTVPGKGTVTPKLQSLISKENI